MNYKHFGVKINYHFLRKYFMISFIVSVILLICGYILYGNFVEKVFGPDDRQTPAYAINDGVDYIPMPLWKVYLIQLLNIAGTGPIFGALAGAAFGPIVYFWIVFGCIFAGAVHDYFCGMLSVRMNGSSVSEITGHFLGSKALLIMRIFSVILLVFCAVVFTIGPAGLLDIITPPNLNTQFWYWIILLYYFIATFVPIDKVIGKIYPVFGVCLIVMALGVSGSLLFSGKFVMPEIWDNFANLHAKNLPVWPIMFITVACGAISGFHATQSPMMARCIQNEKQGRKVFYGAMISEGLIALVWAAGGVTCYENSAALIAAGGGSSKVVYEICTSTMGQVGAVLAMLGVIACPITSGDTAYRSARLTIADWFKIDQANWNKRFYVTLPLLLTGFIIGQCNYSMIWRYFSWANQTLAMIVLWAASVYLIQEKKNWKITAIPATFMTAVSVTYFLTAPECLGLVYTMPYPAAVAIGIVTAVLLFVQFIGKYLRNNITDNK